MSTFNINLSNKKQVNWTESQLTQKLQGLKKADRKCVWIRSDLATEKSSWLGRLLWTVVAKRFQWMRQAFYGVNLERSQKILNQLRPQIQSSGDQSLIKLFNEAVQNYNAIAPWHISSKIYDGGSDGTSTLDDSSIVINGEDSLYGQPSSASETKIDLKTMDHGNLHYRDAEKMLNGKPTGTFLIRNSSDTSFKVLSVVGSNGLTTNLRFEKVAAKFYLQNSSFAYATLEQLALDQGFTLINAIYPGGAVAQKLTSSVISQSQIDLLSSIAKRKNYELEYQQAVQKGEDKNELLKKAFQEELPAICAWLISQGASMATLNLVPHPTKTQQDLLNWLNLQHQPVSIEPKNLDHFALKMGLGYKTANLMVMEAKAEAMTEQLKDCEVKVPPFIGIGDYEMTQLLKTEIPEIFDMWKQFLNSFDPSVKQAFVDATTCNAAAKVPLKVTENGEDLIREIQTKVKAYFKKNPYHSPQMRAWLEKEKPEFVIIRSTGKEDSDTNSNAGGNDSIPFVKPNEEKISEALGEVVASYFGSKSIKQRLAAGDQSLFSERQPFIPALIQTMIGENVGGVGTPEDEVPRCGVLFTRQSDKAEGVTFIQTGLGNNEGVVSSQVGVDSYYVKDGKIHSVVREKETRFVALQESSGKYKVDQIKNSQSLSCTQALPNNVVLDIKRVADSVSEDYGKEKGGVKPMDMEYTVKLKGKGQNKPVIYLLQARPLLDTKGKDAIEHTYLDLAELNTVPKENVVSGETLLDGNAWVREVEDPSTVLFVDDLPQGLKQFLDHPDPTKIKAIISRKTAPATSHEAVTLRPKGVAVMVVSDKGEYNKLKQLSTQADSKNPLLIDTQRGVMVLTPEGKDHTLMIKKGLVSYPIPLEVSIPKSLMMSLNTEKLKHNKPGQNLVKAYIEHLNDWSAELIKELGAAGQLDAVEKKTMRELFDIMATQDAPQAKAALGRILHLMKARLIKSMADTDENLKGTNKPMFAVFEAALKMAQTEILPAIDKYPPQSLERLYSIKFLDAMMFQQPAGNVLNAHSYLQTLAIDKSQKETLKLAAKEGIDFKGPNAKWLIALHQLHAFALSQNCGSDWKQLVKEISALDEKSQTLAIQKLMPLVAEMQKMDIAEVWMSTVFANAWKKAGSLSGKLRVASVTSSIEQAQKDNQKTFQWIQDNAVILNGLEQQIPMWGEPAFVKKNLAKLKNRFKNELGFDPNGLSPNALDKMYNSSGELGKLALLQYMRRAINIYDCKIKAAKGSSDFTSEKEQAQAIADMLEGYFDMMRATFRLIPSQSEQISMNQPSMGSGVDFASYIQRLENGYTFNKTLGGSSHTSIGFNTLKAKVASMGNGELKNQFLARPEFAVDAMVVTHKGDKHLAVYWPERLEEYFTTFHQNMEVVVSYLNVKNSMNEQLLEETPKQICLAAKGKFGQNLASLKKLDDGKIQAGYNIPLRQHSGSFTVEYNPKKPDEGIDVQLHMFGNDEHDRWDQSAAYGAALGYILGEGLTDSVAPKINYANPVEAQFKMHFPKGFKDHQKLINALHNLAKSITFKESYQWSDNKSKDLLTYLENDASPVDWKKVDEECFQHTFYLNHALLQRYGANGDDTMLFKVAKNSLIGMARAKITDYTRGKSSGSPALRAASLAAIEKALAALPAAAPELQAMLKDPDIVKLPGVEAKLKQILATTLTPEEAVEKYLKDEDCGAALVVAVKSKNGKLTAKVKEKIKQLIQGGKSQKAFDAYKQLFTAGNGKIADEYIMQNGLQAALSVEQAKELQTMSDQRARKVHATNMTASVQALQKLALNFDANYEQILKLSVSSLIGLSQLPNSESYNDKSFGAFQGLDNYLGKDTYNYVYQNVYGDTSKLRKAGPLYIIKALASSQSAQKAAAEKALEELAQDYVYFGKKGAHADGYRLVVYAVARGYLDGGNHPSQLIQFFAKDKAVLNDLSDWDGLTSHQKITLKQAIAGAKL